MANSGGGNTTQSNILVNVQVQGQQQVQQATQQVQQLNSTAQRSGQINMAAPVQTLRQQLRQAQNDLQRMASLGQQNTAQFAATARQVQQLRNDIDETNNSIRAFDPDNKFKVFANFASAGAKALQGYAGAMAFIGVESEDAQKTIAKLQGLMAFSDAIDSLGDIKDSFKDLGRLLGLTTTQTVAATTATGAQTTATVAQTTATNAQTVATQGATVATNTLGTAFKALGIGLLIAAVAYLISNWDSLKASVQKLIPALGETKGGFDKISQVISGVGSVIINVLKAPIDALITQFKVLYKVMTGDFAGAVSEIKKGAQQLVNDFNVVGNYQAGVASKAAAQLEEQRKEQLKKDITHLQDRIEVLKAGGKNVEALQKQLYQKQLEAAKGNEEEIHKLKQAYAVQQASDEKARAEKAKAENQKRIDENKAKLKEDLANLKKNADEANKIVANASKTEKDIELANLNAKYKAEFDLLEKRKKDIKDYNAQFNSLTEAKKIEEAAIVKKYNETIKAYDDEVNTAYLNSYEKRALEINKKADELLKNATPEQRNKIEQNRAFQLNQNTAESNAADKANTANVGLVNAENANRPSTNDTPDEAVAKVNALAKAKLDAENAAFELKRAKLEGQQNELELLEAEHQKNITDINYEQAESRKSIAESEKEAKLATLEAIGGALTGVSALVGEQSVAGKALAVATATIDTYVGATKALAQGGLFGYIGAAGIIATGLANVKKIVQTQIPGTTGNGSTSAPSISAPVINSTVLQQAQNGTNTIKEAITDNNKQSQNIRAYIVDKDLEKQKSKTSFFNTQSTI